ncbi:AfsR/SARP family transcriptional regulator [Streptosporangium oxazolinicum]|uniref:AfsR/SARP family transcriptional regulator n=1 Tax=Streptosporangium oxazolinicum TaxID=909287 RepID=UPI0031EEC08C
MEFRVLGALEVTASGRQLDLGGSRQQIVLAVLILNANHSVTLDRLVEAIYDDDPPATSRAQVQICISALRRLFSAHGHPEMIVTTRQGYVLRVTADAIDARRFESLVSRARKARNGRCYQEAIQHYRDALALWRGPALEGIESRLVRSLASWTAEQRITANEDCVQLELDLGRHHELVGELVRLVREHPLREGLIGQLMLALYRSGRQAEALQAYRDARQLIVEELGIEPNERLQQLEAAILTSEELLDPHPPPAEVPVETRARAPSVPGMLPADIADFIGRQEQIDVIRRRLTVPLEGAGRFAVPIVTVAGRAGIGKTTVAVHAAHSIASHFPDGQLYADLHGGVSRPVNPMQVLDRFLRAFGVPGTALPETLAERAEMYRMLLADRRVLIVLDDAASESQVLPLLPGSPTSAVIATSRGRLGGLAGATTVDVGLFDSAQSIEMLSRIAGAERVRSEPESAAALAELCCYLPLALRIAGARLAARPHWTVEQLVDRLADEARRLDELKHGGMGIRASLALTYEGISEQARCLFRRLAILHSHIFSAWTGTALLDQPLADAQDLLDDLADAQLVEVVGIGRNVGVQYRFHDLIRVYARERLAEEEPPAERTAALARVLRSLHCLTQAARNREYGPPTGPHPLPEITSPLPAELVERLVAEPIAWFERERPVLLAGIRQAAQAGFAELCWRMAMNAEAFFELRVYLDDWRETNEIALEAARNGGDERGQAEMLCVRGALAQTEQRFDDARRDYLAALPLFERTGDVLQVARSRRNLAFLERMNGELEAAAGHLKQALAIFVEIGDQISAAHTLDNLAAIRAECGDIDDAKIMLAEALVRGKSGGSRRVISQVLHRMGRVHLQAEEFALAAGAFEEALTLVEEMGDGIGESFALHGLGIAQLRRGKPAEAESLLRRALTTAESSQHRLAEAHALSGLGELAIATEQSGDAVGRLRKAVTLFRQVRVPLSEAQTLIMLSEVLQALGDDSAADRALARVHELADEVDDWAGRSLRKHLESIGGYARPASAVPLSGGAG